MLLRKVVVLAILASLVLGAASLLFAFWADGHIEERAAGRVFTRLDDIPKREVALVLGTSKYSRGRLNTFYTARIRAAADLYNAGKVDAILVSGDNGRADYNEPEQMRSDLIGLGVPPEHITADYAGFRTLDSIYRAGDVFGLQVYTIVSQPFHLERAIYLADQKGQDAIGYAAFSPAGYSGQRVRSREVLARALAVLDVEVLGREPKFLGDPVYVERRNPGPL